MKITVKKLSELHKPAHNIRRHSEKQLTEYIRSIEMFGQVKPLVVAEDGEIIAGNGLYEALLRMGRETCDCYVMVGLTDVQKKKLMMADNKVYELGFTDVDAIEELVKELDGDVDVPGWDADLLEMLNSTEDEADEMIGSYGEFPESEISSINRQQNEEHVPYVHHMSAQGIRPGLYQQRRAADTILPSGGAQQPGDNADQIFHAANLMQDADIAVRIVPSEGELDAAVRQAPAR